MKVAVALIASLLLSSCAALTSPSSPAQGIYLTLLVYSDTGAPIPVASAIVDGQSFEVRRGMASLMIQADKPIDVQINAVGYLSASDTLTFHSRTVGRSLTATSWSFYLGVAR